MKETVDVMAHREDMDNRERTGDNREDMVRSKNMVNIEVTVDMVSSRVDMEDMDSMVEIVDSKVVLEDIVVMDREVTENRVDIIRDRARATGASAAADNKVVMDNRAANGAARVVTGVTRAIGAVRADKEAATGAVRVALGNKAAVAGEDNKADMDNNMKEVMEAWVAMANGITKIMMKTKTRAVCREDTAAEKKKNTMTSIT